MKITKLGLIAGVAVPVLYFGTIVAGGFVAPDYSHFSQYASELGMAGEPSAGLFNSGILATAVATLLASVGIYLAGSREGGGRVWSALAGVALALFGVGLVFGSLYPMPDPRHGGFGLGMAIHLAPLFLALALRSAPGRANLSRFLFLATFLMAGSMLPMFGVGGFVTSANVGLFQRLYALVVFGWVGVASLALLRPGSDSTGP